MLSQVVEMLNLRPGMSVLDATIGVGGHAKAILEKVGTTGMLVGIDRDFEILEMARSYLGSASRVRLIQGDFRYVEQILKELGIDRMDACLLDLGVSSYQLEKAERGFSFQRDGILDMRMDSFSVVSAFDLVNHLSEWEITTILRRFGEERYSKRIARLIVQTRQRSPIRTTRELATIVERAIPHYQWGRIHPATRTFQAFRMEVNHELESLEEALPQVVKLLNQGGRFCVISFHSLEDRIVKKSFQKFVVEQQLRLVTKKPLIPELLEIYENPRSRSAKLRVVEKC